MVSEPLARKTKLVPIPGGSSEPSTPDPIYRHPDSPNFGDHWMKELLTFDKVISDY